MIDELYHSLDKELTGWCTSMTGSRTLAEDLVQEAFLRALINADLLEGLDHARRRAWMYRTVKNLFVDKKRREAFESTVWQIPEEGLGERLTKGREESFEEGFEESFVEAGYAQVDDAQLLTLLTPEERMLFTLRYLQGYHSAELGELFHMPPGTVRSKLSGARKRLRQSLEENSRQGRKKRGKKNV